MSAAHPRRFIIGAFVLVGVLGALRHLRNGDTPPLRILFGAGIGAVILLVLSEAQPKIAAALAAFAALSVALTSGGALDTATRILDRK